MDREVPIKLCKELGEWVLCCVHQQAARYAASPVERGKGSHGHPDGAFCQVLGNYKARCNPGACDHNRSRLEHNGLVCACKDLFAREGCEEQQGIVVAKIDKGAV